MMDGSESEDETVLFTSGMLERMKKKKKKGDEEEDRQVRKRDNIQGRIGT